MAVTFPEGYGLGSTLVCIDDAFLPLVGGALKVMERPYYWASDEDYRRGYHAVAALQVELMGRCVDKLILEIRALRGGSAPAPEWRDPEADPAAIGLSTLGGVIVEQAATTDKLEEVRALVQLILESAGDGADVEAILENVQLIALLLGV